MVRITMEDGGIIDIELNEEVAPITCENFKKLVREGFYNGLTFHRVIPGFMIQGGCPLGNGTGGPGWNIKGEFAANGVNNPLKHTRGVISMARSMNPNSAGSQFFIMHQDAPHLDGQYAAFGKVVAGMDVVDKIASVRTDWNDKPTTPVKMATVELIEGLFCASCPTSPAREAPRQGDRKNNISFSFAVSTKGTANFFVQIGVRTLDSWHGRELAASNAGLFLILYFRYSVIVLA